MSLHADFQWFNDNEDALRLEHQGTFIVIKDQAVISSGHESPVDAVKSAKEDGYEQGTFLVQFVDPISGKSAPVHFSSQVYL